MANVNGKARVLVRDGVVCQYCGCLLLLPQVVKVLDWPVPGLELVGSCRAWLTWTAWLTRCVR